MNDDKLAIDEVAAAFFGAFANRDGEAADVDRLYRLFIPEAVIIKNLGKSPEVYDVAGFVEPRRALLGEGSLKDFSEEEASEETTIFGNIAQRFSRYTKSWVASGKPFRGSGAKSLQFVRTGEGWRIASLVWDDEAG